MRSFTYCWLHIPSGRSGKRVVQYPSWTKFLEAMDDYNRLGRDQWKYWTQP